MKLVFLFIAIINITSVFAQHVTLQKPLSYQLKNKNIEDRVSVKTLDLDQVFREDSIDYVEHEQFNVARLQNVDLDFTNIQKYYSNNLSLVQKIVLELPKAREIAIKFEKLVLPKGSQLFIYTPDKNTDFLVFDGDDKGFEKTHFISKSIKGEQLVIEYNQFSDFKETPQINILGVLNFYNKGIAANPGFAQSTECEVNTACSEGELWCQEIQSVVRIFIQSGSSYSYCSGSVINNTNQDFTPYVLTAAHCGSYASTEDLEYWKFDFNYQSSDCESPSSESEIQSQYIVGCEYIAHASRIAGVGSDFRLVKLLDSIPKAWSISYAGWDVEDYTEISGGGVGIHHPYGDIKKISNYSKTLVGTNANGGSSSDEYWKTYWVETENGFGITEGGSSGSPLFNSKGLIIGTLATGSSFCDNRKTFPDFYGKMSRHWDKNGSDITKQLKPWLDPKSTGVKQLGTLLSNTNIACGERVSYDNFIVFPSPASKSINIANDDFSIISDAIVEIYDVKGSLVHVERTNKVFGVKKIDVSTLSDGFYVLKLKKSDLEFQQKFIVSHK